VPREGVARGGEVGLRRRADRAGEAREEPEQGDA
jgi:hypothetical protein